MTRYTNVGRKRTYVQAGFEGEGDVAAAGPGTALNDDGNSGLAKAAVSHGANDDNGAGQPVKKKTHRAGKKLQKKRERAAGGEVGGEAVAGGDEQARGQNAPSGGKEGGSVKKKKVKAAHKASKTQLLKAKASEARRISRIKEKAQGTTCFMCREPGHSAKYCPKAGEDGGAKGKSIVGMCYRCGSQDHPLSRCRRKENPDDPLPFATCFVCSGNGHLASSCPQNAAKGVYPNGGACKLCGEKTHLAKNCGLRKPETPSTAYFGTGREAGADEDDFHTIKRKRMEVDETEKAETFITDASQAKPTLDRKPRLSAPKKVVNF